MAAAASSSAASSSSVVELMEAAELDTATSAMFFHDDGARGDSSWPEAEKTMSKLTSQGALRALCDRYYIPADYTPLAADGGAPPEGSICVYAEALEAGMRFPLHEFYVSVLRHLGLAPTQLAPNAWRYMAGFVLLCSEAGVEPLLSAFFSLFSVCTRKRYLLGCGWHHFKPRRRLFSGKMPRSADWRSGFFYLQSPANTTWPCPVLWGKPSRAAVRKLPVATAATKEAIEKLLGAAGSSGIDVMKFLSGRSLPVGRQASTAATPQQVAVKVEAATRKRKSPEIGVLVPACGSTSTPPGSSAAARQSSAAAGQRSASARRALLNSMTGVLQQMVQDVDEGEQALEATKGEVAQLKEALQAAVAQHAAEVGRLAAEHGKACAAHAAELEKARAERAAELEKARAEHAAEAARRHLVRRYHRPLRADS